MPATRARTKPAAHAAVTSPPRISQELQCPLCGGAVPVPAGKLAERAAVLCPHCGGEPELTREWDETTGRSHWVLVDSLADPEEEQLG